jgi:hypothetical protein
MSMLDAFFSKGGSGSGFRGAKWYALPPRAVWGEFSVSGSFRFES